MYVENKLILKSILIFIIHIIISHYFDILKKLNKNLIFIIKKKFFIRYKILIFLYNIMYLIIYLAYHRALEVMTTILLSIFYCI